MSTYTTQYVSTYDLLPKKTLPSLKIIWFLECVTTGPDTSPLAEFNYDESSKLKFWMVVSHDQNELAYHIQIIVTSTQEVENAIPNLGPAHTILGQSN